ncbi:MAG: platelet-activating factor acetylhydrolase IB subunit [Isosphaeraceae bacterium]
MRKSKPEVSRVDQPDGCHSPRLLRRAWGFGALLTAGLIATGMAACAQSPATNNAIKPEPREGGWMELHKSFLERTKQGDVGVLFLGDSITHGWANRSDGGPGPIWDRYYAPRKAANFGIGGDRTQHVLWRLDHGEIDGIEPRAVVLMIGTNNINADTPAEIAEGIKTIVEKLHTRLPKTKVLLLGVFPRGPKGDAVRERVKAVNERIARLDDGGKTVKYLDIGPKFLEPDGTLKREIMPDLLHLSRRGYQIWADAIEPTLWSLVDEPAATK